MKALTTLSGFPEWLPEIRQVEMEWLDRIRKIYESYGFVPIETPAIERLQTLQAKGDIDKEIYIVKKPHKDSKEEYGLHYDLTIPFARYVAQHHGQLSFPFKRYQIQKVWRGERPQKGRSREFYQCDVDVINVNHLSPYYDLEMLLVGHEVLTSLDIPPFIIEVSNRKIYEGYLEALGLTKPLPALRIIDKIDKIGIEGVIVALQEKLNCTTEFAEKLIKPARIKCKDLGFIEGFKKLDVKSTKANEGLEELKKVITFFSESDKKNIQVNLGFVRGFDYYTGIIYEGRFLNDPNYGSICSGGRYENLVGSFINKRMPGVGFSVGFSRIFSKVFEDGLLSNLPQDARKAFVARTSDNDLHQICRVAEILRKKGLQVEVYGEVDKVVSQFRIANKRGFRWLWIASREDPEVFEVKDLRTGIQKKVDVESWEPDQF